MSDLDKIKAVFDEVGVPYNLQQGSVKKAGEDPIPHVFITMIDGGLYGTDCDMVFDDDGNYLKTEVCQ